MGTRTPVGMFQHKIIVSRDLHIQIQAILQTKAKSGDSHMIPKSCKQLEAFKN